MRKSSIVLLGICAVIVLGLLAAYYSQLHSSHELTTARATAKIHLLEVAVRNKDIGYIMSQVDDSPNVRIAHMRPDKLRQVLASAFAAMHSPQADVHNISVVNNGATVVVSGDLVVKDGGPDFSSAVSSGHLTLYYHRINTPVLFGLFHQPHWRIFSADWNGDNPNDYGSY